jgi:hypothetical protein
MGSNLPPLRKALPFWNHQPTRDGGQTGGSMGRRVKHHRPGSGNIKTTFGDRVEMFYFK